MSVNEYFGHNLILRLLSLGMGFGAQVRRKKFLYRLIEFRHRVDLKQNDPRR
jgi:hypothetical protein